ncbi:dTDP-glucose 4,6-dehydratase [Aurantibacter sp.]|uniref:dTDP-glucose 4,6-dehydratase n=1 Tax=Aurantibacter sp. TaxID=2807103 RepID=UPI0035C813FB
MKSKSLLVSGGAGFIGANFIEYFIEKHKEIKLVNVDKLTYAGDLNNLNGIHNSNYTFIEGDICNRKLLHDLFTEHQFDGVIHFAAESHVDNSIKSPGAFIETNITGTFNLIDVARNFWMDAPNQYKNGFEHARFHHISTDEVYGTLGETGLFTEKTPYAPNSPYSASKASSDFIVRSYFHTYGMNVVTTNCSNNYGPKQHNEKLIPTIIKKAISGEQIPIYGNGLNVRDWLYVLDHCKGIETVFSKGKTGETYNIGGKNERNNLYIVNTICSILDNVLPGKEPYNKQISFVDDRAGHDFRYAIDASKIETELGWKADENFETGIKKTVTWYLNKYKKQ